MRPPARPCRRLRSAACSRSCTPTAAAAPWARTTLRPSTACAGATWRETTSEGPAGRRPAPTPGCTRAHRGMHTLALHCGSVALAMRRLPTEPTQAGGAARPGPTNQTAQRIRKCQLQRWLHRHAGSPPPQVPRSLQALNGPRSAVSWPATRLQRPDATMNSSTHSAKPRAVAANARQTCDPSLRVPLDSCCSKAGCRFPSPHAPPSPLYLPTLPPVPRSVPRSSAQPLLSALVSSWPTKPRAAGLSHSPVHCFRLPRFPDSTAPCTLLA